MLRYVPPVLDPLPCEAHGRLSPAVIPVDRTLHAGSETAPWILQPCRPPWRPACVPGGSPMPLVRPSTAGVVWALPRDSIFVRREIL
jgi:hypothetical protein